MGYPGKLGAREQGGDMIPRLMILVLATQPALAQGDDWSRTTSELRSAALGTSVEKFITAAEKVAKDNSPRAAKLLLGTLSTKPVEAYWVLITCLGKVTDPEGVAEIERAVFAKATDAALKRDLVASLTFNPSEAAGAALVRILSEGTPDLQVTAIDELVRRESREAIPALIRLLPAEKKKGLGELVRQARKGLVGLTGADQGSPEAWAAWWERNKDTFKVGETAVGTVDTVVATIKRNRALDYEELKKGREEEILVLQGCYDTVQDVLDSLKIPYTVLSREALGRQDLSKCKALLVNCHDYKHSGRLKKGDLEKVHDFAAGGGYVFTSDWGLADVLEGAFPGYVQCGGEVFELNTAIFPKKGSAAHPFLREVFSKVKEDRTIERVIAHGWQIDSDSYAVSFDPKKVVVLVEAPKLQNSGVATAVAVTFGVGAGAGAASPVATGGVYEDFSQQKGGKVLHVMSHFSKQKSKQDGYTLQNMLLNFLIEAKDRKHGQEKK
jgi:hypothetical protein